MTASKNLKRETRLPIAPYGGLAYGTKVDSWRPIGGLNINFTRDLSSTVIFDGVPVHPSLNYVRQAFSLLMVKGREPGYSISF